MTEVWGAKRLLFSRKEAALLLGVSRRTVDFLISTNRLSSSKIGSRRMIPRDALLNYYGSGLASRLDA